MECGPKTQKPSSRYQDCHNTQFGGKAFAGMNGRIKCFTVQLKGFYICSEKAFLKELPYLLVTMYPKAIWACDTHDEKLIGARIDAVIPELRLAFAFFSKRH